MTDATKPPGPPKGPPKGPAKSKADDGFIAGLQFWLIFLIGFVFLGYPIVLAIVFGAVAGMAGGITVTWWQTLTLIKGSRQLVNDADRLLQQSPEDLGDGAERQKVDRYDRTRMRRQYNTNRTRKSLLPWRRSRE
jgi:hypothetical protein